MKMRLTAQGVEVSTELKEFIDRRIHFGLGRFKGKIKSLSVRLADINGPRGGIDKCCDIRVDAGLSQEVIVSERQETLFAAVALAMDRVERAVKRQLNLGRLAARRSEAASEMNHQDRHIDRPHHSSCAPILNAFIYAMASQPGIAAKLFHAKSSGDGACPDDGLKAPSPRVKASAQRAAGEALR